MKRADAVESSRLSPRRDPAANALATAIADAIDSPQETRDD